ncbi:MAG: hypothetical protein GF383_12840 [Candidatus Lokiarchaeota archaeon]|nr:hypothetical protein [Candidatus Lokiarchaeota archaeon]MBD3341974.1 hypothetical protein [Candidatus Lokiarchaeota archaeon]
MGCKATLFDYDGQIMDESYKEYSMKHPQPGWDELDPTEVWESVKIILKDLRKKNSNAEIESLSTSSLGEAAVLIDSKGDVLCNAMLYTDNRGQKELDYIINELGKKSIFELTGQVAHPMYTLVKMLWLKKNRPKIIDKTWKILLFEDYIGYKLTNETIIDYTLASRTMALDIKRKEWATEMLNIVGIPETKFSSLQSSGTPLGQIKKQVANSLNLPKVMLVTTGSWDQASVALGTGAIKTGIASVGIGTTECLTIPLNKPIVSEKMMRYNFPCAPHIIDNMYLTIAFNMTTGSLLRWFRNTIAKKAYATAERKGKNIYQILDDSATKNPTDLFILPHFGAAGNPYMDPEATGAILGLRLNTTTNELYKAILEGTTYEIMLILECLTDAGIPIEELRAVGGGSKSSIWLQLKASMLGRLISVPRINEAGTLGCAILAGVGAGVYKNFQNAVNKLIKIDYIYKPNNKLHAIYSEKYKTYKRIYPKLKEIYGRD